MFWNIAFGLGAALSVIGIGRALEHRSEAQKGGKTPITPPGAPQPPGTVAVPPSPGAVDGDPLHTAARGAITALKTGSPAQSSQYLAAVQAFQTAWNATKPPTPLKADGRYGPKTQAALQSVVSPAVAPTALIGSKAGVVKVSLPPIAAAQAFPGQVDVVAAARILAGMGAIGKSSDPRVTTFQHSYNEAPGILHLVEDGKYGGATEGALQAVLDYMGTGLTAPRNPFGTKVPAPSYPPAAETIELG